MEDVHNLGYTFVTPHTYCTILDFYWSIGDDDSYQKLIFLVPVPSWCVMSPCSPQQCHHNCFAVRAVDDDAAAAAMVS